MKKLFNLFIGVIIATNLSAKSENEESDKGWKYNGNIGLNFSQTSFTNWASGGDNSVAGNGVLNVNANYNTEHWLWQNNLNLEYGLTRTSGYGIQKSTDKIDFSTLIGYTTTKIWYYSAMADFKSQFYKGYNYPDKEHYISNFMAPGYVTVSVGIEYKPEYKFYSVYFSPVAGKFTFVNDRYLSDLGSFGVDPGKRFKAQLGVYLKPRLEKEIMQNVNLVTNATFFTAYDKSFGNIDVEWNLLLNMKINSILNASISTTLKYDDDVKYIDSNNVMKGPRVQFKEVIGVGIGYNF